MSNNWTEKTYEFESLDNCKRILQDAGLGPGNLNIAWDYDDETDTAPSATPYRCRLFLDLGWEEAREAAKILSRYEVSR